MGYFLFVIVYGVFRISTFKISDKKVKVGLIQPNLDPWGKWSNIDLNDLPQFILIFRGRQLIEGAKVIFWPETALPVYLREADTIIF